MRTVRFGEIETSVLGFGCGSVMGRAGRRDSLRAMHAAWDAGITLFDTARSYGYGEAEGLLGQFLTGKRSQATVVTKFGILPAAPSRWKHIAKPLVRRALSVVPQARQMVRRRIAGEMSPGHFDVATLRASLEESLRQLRTDYVDVLLAHDAPPSVMAQEDLMAELEAVVRTGKTRRVGLSCSFTTAQQVMQSAPLALGALQWPAQAFAADDPSQQNAQDHLFLMANHPFGGGDHADRLAAKLRNVANEPTLPRKLREALRGNAKTAAARVVFSNLLQTAGVHVIVPSMLHLEHLRANIAAMETESLSLEECRLLGQWFRA